MVLRGARCSVRKWRAADAESIVRHANNINVARNLRDRFPHPYTRADAKAFLRRIVRDEAAMNFAIEVEGEAVGAIGFTIGADIERFSAEIGYWLGESLWGRGIVTEALVMITDHAFDRFNLLRLFALPFADNPASVRVLEKAGYLKEGCLRASAVKFGQVRDQLLYSRTNDRWRGP